MAVDKTDVVNTADAAPPGAVKPEGRRPDPISRFIREVWVELKKTNWPTGNELTKFTMVVMITIVLVAIYLFCGDQLAYQITKIVGMAPQATTSLGH